MSSVQGSHQVSAGTIDRVKSLLDELQADKASSNVNAAMKLRQQLERNVRTSDGAKTLVGQLSEDQQKLLEKQVNLFPAAVQALFKDSWGHVYVPTDDVNNKDVGKARNVRTQGAASPTIRGDQVVQRVSIENLADGQPVGATSRAGARPKVRKVAEPTAAPVAAKAAPANGADAQAPAAKAEAEDAAGASARASSPETVAPQGAANSDGVAQADAAATQTAHAATDDVRGEARTESGAKPIEPEIEELHKHIIGFVHACVNPESNALFAAARDRHMQYVQRVEGYRADLKRIGDLKRIPKKDRSSEESAELASLERSVKADKPPVEVEQAFDKAVRELAELPSKVGFLNQYYGLKKARALDKDTAEGQETLKIIDELAGRDTDLPLNIKKEIAEFRKTSPGKEFMALRTAMDAVDAQIAGKLKGSDLGNVFDQIASGKKPDENALRKLLGMPPVGNDTTVSGRGGPPRPPPPGGGAPPEDPNDPNRDKWFNPANKSWFGLSRARHEQLRQDGHSELLQAIQDYHSKQQTMHTSQASRLQSMMSILNSGLPIESILLLFMGMMTENEEEKLKIKMAEIVVAEQFERVNRKLQADQNFARDLWRKYGSIEGVPVDQRENIDNAQLEKMAGLTWTRGVTTEEATRMSTRGKLFKKLREDGVGAEKLATVKFNDGKIDEEALKAIGIDPEALKTAGVETEEDWNHFASVAPDMPEKDIEDLAGRKRVVSEARFVDVTLNPSEFGFTNKPSQALVQELQVQMQNYKQIMETFTAVIRMLQDIVARITQNIR